MSQSKSIFKANVIYGFIVLVPIGVIALLIMKMVEILEKIAEPLGLESAIGSTLAVIVALLVFVLLCLIAGTMVRTRLGAVTFERIENKVLKQIPGYQIISNGLRGFVNNETAYPGAMVSLYGPGTAVFGFVMEEGESDLMTVYIPSAPVVTAGTILMVQRDRVHLIDASAIAVSDCVSQWGVGSLKIAEAAETGTFLKKMS